MKRTLIHNATIVNEGRSVQGSVVIEGDRIAEVLTYGKKLSVPCDETIDATGCCLLPGVIDDHVHFRDPGLTHKADILTESRAAAAGGVTSIMDMPNTNPLTTTLSALEQKFDLLNEKCIVNHSCYFGATNNNYTEFNQLDKHRVCGIKLFMGSSTGNMLVDKTNSLLNIFNGTDMLIATHCESQEIIKKNTEYYKKMFSDAPEVPISKHPNIRSSAACYASTELAVRMASLAGARLHVLHVSTAKELQLFSDIPLEEKHITAEACVAHLLYRQQDYKELGTRIKCNPSIKKQADRDALRNAVNTGVIDVIATDHAPHLLSEKEGGALKAMSGMPMIQFSLVSMLELAEKGIFSIETIVEKMCHAPVQIYGICDRGYVREGYKADLVLVSHGDRWEVNSENILSKCGWSPLEGNSFRWKVERTFANGHLIYSDGQVDDTYRGEELRFDYKDK
ncbi:dihydroorotase [Bacteroides cellulosilyticus]|jgi:dihydroorotase, multifunctional complex type|uniref:Dihydroorotase n=2 Tax=Bacteroides cellulosilyticus TaxID=246787 RepID=A0A642PTK0_9BACE|nr:dihydroorotase [Bacteroides cellulosilyticus]EIY29131.1 dihydroorotase, multifunctional complex type [Bacteroides cellulosilyticus CL02T12C19]KAA5415715.1 dihydroorotase [Bacteroides cellulosilyticus]MCB6592147.1 dihydroorotase [Bacteroides cellulosilyticus]QUT90595.1 Dihydroorotase [Bacteroides cellulosilyticus]